MAYKIIVSFRAQIEIEKAIEYYKLNSLKAPRQFINNLKKTYDTLEINPFFEVRYKNVRSIRIPKFPHSLFYVIIEEQSKIKIISCFHNKQNPDKRPNL